MIKEFFLFLRAVIIMIPVTIVLLVMFTFFYFFIREPKEESDARDNHNYLDHFDA